MTKEDLKKFTREELEELFVSQLNEMETTGNKYIKESDNLIYDEVRYSYGAALLTRVNYIRAVVAMKNQKVDSEIEYGFGNAYC